MPFNRRLTAQLTGISLVVAGCGGRPSDVPAAGAKQTQMSAAPARSIAPAPVEISAPRIAASAPIGGAEGEMTQMRQQIAMLRRDMSELRQQIARMPGSAVAAAPSPDPRKDPEARLRAQQAAQQRIASREAAFRSEPQDAGWSLATAANVRTTLASAGESIRDQVRSVECRSQSCRIEISAGPNGSQIPDLPMVLFPLMHTFPTTVAGQIDQGDGRMATVLYLSR